MNYIVTIDGPSSSGKSTLAKRLAKELSISHIDSGSIYRAVTLYAIENNFIAENMITEYESMTGTTLSGHYTDTIEVSGSPFVSGIYYNNVSQIQLLHTQ